MKTKKSNKTPPKKKQEAANFIKVTKGSLTIGGVVAIVIAAVVSTILGTIYLLRHEQRENQDQSMPVAQFSATTFGSNSPVIGVAKDASITYETKDHK
ncbi:hypothetical protein ACO0LD_09130 [Undibacterium sp. Ji83W]|uniref:hypothetical protein n=1 Tax=Undibacterium sp. Ji83W TaxID=3413043 RepID=UPI003BF3C294